MSLHYSVSAELKYIGTCVGDTDIVIRSEPDLAVVPSMGGFRAETRNKVVVRDLKGVGGSII